jgi:hypothetical protein
MNTPTFKEQFDKITRAYFNDELKPLNSCACFIGNIFDKDSRWQWIREFDTTEDNCSRWRGIKNERYPWMRDAASEYIKFFFNGFYSCEDIINMESNFLTIWDAKGGRTEQSLFEAMDSTLDMLRRIHESKGEIIESYEFKPRNLKEHAHL